MVWSRVKRLNWSSGKELLGFFSSAKAKLAASKLVEEQLYAHAAEEVASGQIRQGLWAKAIAETGGDEAAAKAQYLKLRVEIMRAEAEITEFAANKASRANESQKFSKEKGASESNDGLADMLVATVILMLLGLIAFVYGSSL